MKHRHGEAPVAIMRDPAKRGLSALATLASVDIETSLVANLSDDLHLLFDPVSDDVLPIYFGPLLGRLYLEGL
jgi:hypothetical protein